MKRIWLVFGVALLIPGCAVHVAGNQPTLDDHTRRLAGLEQATGPAVGRLDTIDKWAGDAERRIQAMDARLKELEGRK